MKMPRQAVCVSSNVIWLVMPIDFLYNVGYLSYASPKDRKERAFEMDRDTMIVTMLGTRGSVSVSGEAFHEFGGATTCVRVCAADQEIFLDLGSGIVGVKPEPEKKVSILLTHPHLDHLTGLPFFKGLSEKGRRIEVYLKPRNGLGIFHVLRYLYTPPLWPIGIFDYPADVHVNGMPERFSLGEVAVSAMEGNHPGGSTIFRLSYRDVSFVFATDYEHTEEADQRLIAFAQDCSLLIYDGQYTSEEYERCRGFGHSTAEHGISIAKACGAKRLWITHHAPEHTDEMLRELEQEAQQMWDGICFARDGMELAL